MVWQINGVPIRYFDKFREISFFGQVAKLKSREIYSVYFREIYVPAKTDNNEVVIILVKEASQSDHVVLIQSQFLFVPRLHRLRETGSSGDEKEVWQALYTQS